jgi:formate-dependent nitrite reductase membrane component NrfD
MQACPYDALYLNEDLGAVEKCHFCAHRVEKGLEPACVTVCPVGAIIPGDFDDPESRVSLIRRAQVLSVRRPEQGTGPNVMYIGANDVALNPGRAEKPNQYIWSQRRDTKPEPWPTEVGTQPDAREVLNADHKVEWGWTVGLYLLTKGIAAGAAILAPFIAMFAPNAMPRWLPQSVALLFTAITVFLLIEDLAKPTHFYKLFTRPNWNSWLVKGGIVLTVFAGLSVAILLCGFFRSPADHGEFDFGIETVKNIGAPQTHLIGLVWLFKFLPWLNAAVGILAAGYTAFLFKQCKGRDLWEADGLLWHLLAQSLTSGAAFFVFAGMSNAVTVWALLLGGLAIGMLHFLPIRERDKTDNFKQAQGFLHEARFGKFRIAKDSNWLIPALAALSIALLFAGQYATIPLTAIGALALGVLLLYELAFVRAGQLPPLS